MAWHLLVDGTALLLFGSAFYLLARLERSVDVRNALILLVVYSGGLVLLQSRCSPNSDTELGFWVFSGAIAGAALAAFCGAVWPTATGRVLLHVAWAAPVGWFTYVAVVIEPGPDEGDWLLSTVIVAMFFSSPMLVARILLMGATDQKLPLANPDIGTGATIEASTELEASDVELASSTPGWKKRAVNLIWAAVGVFMIYSVISGLLSNAR